MRKDDYSVWRDYFLFLLSSADVAPEVVVSQRKDQITQGHQFPFFLLLLLHVRVAYVYVCMCAHMLVSTHCVWVCVEGRGRSSDPISTSLGQGLLAGHYACLTINMGAKDLNSSLHTCETISFPIEPFPQLPWALNFESLKPYW